MPLPFFALDLQPGVQPSVRPPRTYVAKDVVDVLRSTNPELEFTKSSSLCVREFREDAGLINQTGCQRWFAKIPQDPLLVQNSCVLPASICFKAKLPFNEPMPSWADRHAIGQSGMREKQVSAAHSFLD